MRRKFFNLFKRDSRTGQVAYSFPLSEECQVNIGIVSDGPVSILCTDVHGELHPLMYGSQGTVNQTIRLKGARDLVVKPAKKTQTVSFDVSARSTTDKEASILDPTDVVVAPSGMEGLSMKEMILAELARYGITRDDDGDESNDLEFEDELSADFGDGYMEPDEFDQEPPVEPPAEPQEQPQEKKEDNPPENPE